MKIQVGGVGRTGSFGGGLVLLILAVGLLGGCSEEADADAILANSGNSGAAANSCEISFNGQAETGDFTDWTILSDGPDPWSVCTPGKFCTSYTWAEKSQTIDLLAKGVSSAALDAGPDFAFSENFLRPGTNSSPSIFYLIVQLRDGANNPIATYDSGNLTNSANNTNITISSNSK